MRNLTLALVAAAAMAQTPAARPTRTAPILRCRDSAGRPCTAKQIQALSEAVFAGKQQHDALAAFHELTLASSDGTLKCVQNDSSACTTPQLDLVKEIAAGQQLYVNYTAAKPNPK